MTITLDSTEELAEADKGTFHQNAISVARSLYSLVSKGISGLTGLTSTQLSTLQETLGNSYAEGAHIGTVGGSLLFARAGEGASSESIANASSEIESVTLRNCKEIN